ncbi:MAG: type-F conjugative transfer system protein TraW [Pseudomonadota bacterium]|nr:MAG: type-F conjugative transfer system protein TraW [Burkholderiales bacterium RIFCSPHIGHO2_01_FULL_63_240]
MACLLTMTCAGVSSCAWGVDLGSIGPTYPISEANLLEFIAQRLRDKQASGELARLQDQARERGIQAVRQPQPVAGLRTTQQPRTFYFDPSFTLDRNILDPQGHLMFAAGSRHNPLDVVSLSRRLLFFDARDARQVKRARELIQRYRGQVKAILTAGSYLDLMKAWRTPVYYDQQGVLTRRLGIAQVPALVSQEGKRLRVDELGVTP